MQRMLSTSGCCGFVSELANGEISKKHVVVLAALVAITAVGAVYCTSLTVTFRATLLATVSVLALSCLIWGIFAKCCLSIVDLAYLDKLSPHPSEETRFGQMFALAKKANGFEDKSLYNTALIPDIIEQQMNEAGVICGENSPPDGAKQWYIAVRVYKQDTRVPSYFLLTFKDNRETFEFDNFDNHEIFGENPSTLLIFNIVQDLLKSGEINWRSEQATITYTLKQS